MTMARLCILLLIAVVCVNAASLQHGNLRHHRANGMLKAGVRGPFKRISIPIPTYETSKQVLDMGLNMLTAEQKAAIDTWQTKPLGDADARQAIVKAGAPKGMSLTDGSTVYDSLVLNPTNEELLMKNWATLIYEDELTLGFLPAHFRLVGITPNGMQPGSFNVWGNNGGASALGHILMIPRKHIFNAVSLHSEDLPTIRHMQAVGKKLALALLTADSFPPKAVGVEAKIPGKNAASPFTIKQRQEFSQAIQKTLPKKLRKAVGVKDIKGAYEFGSHQWIPGGLDLDPSSFAVQNMNEDNIGTFFQVTPNNSVGYLHMHILMLDLLTPNGYDYLTKSPCKNPTNQPDCKEREKKLQGTMTPVDHVIQWVEQNDGKAQPTQAKKGN